MMIEAVILNYLNQRLGVPAYMEAPEKRVREYVLIEKTGSGAENHICSAVFAIQSISDSLLHAAQLNERVKAAMETISEMDEICRAVLNSDYNYTDTSSKEYRYQAVFDVIHY